MVTSRWQMPRLLMQGSSLVGRPWQNLDRDVCVLIAFRFLYAINHLRISLAQPGESDSRQEDKASNFDSLHGHSESPPSPVTVSVSTR